MRPRFCLTLLAAVGFVMPASSSLRAADDLAADIGRQLFMADNCYLCHGTVGQGGAGPRIAPPQIKSESDFSAYVRHPRGRMPPYTTAVSDDADLMAIYVYLQSLPAAPERLPDLLSRPPVASAN